MYEYLLSLYKSGNEEDTYNFKLVKYIEETYPECIEEFKTKDNKRVNYSYAERWIVYDLILACQKYSNLDLKSMNDEELKNVARIVTKAYKHLETRTISFVITKLCSALDVVCQLDTYFERSKNANK